MCAFIYLGYANSHEAFLSVIAFIGKFFKFSVAAVCSYCGIQCFLAQLVGGSQDVHQWLPMANNSSVYHLLASVFPFSFCQYVLSFLLSDGFRWTASSMLYAAKLFKLLYIAPCLYGKINIFFIYDIRLRKRLAELWPLSFSSHSLHLSPPQSIAIYDWIKRPTTSATILALVRRWVSLQRAIFYRSAILRCVSSDTFFIVGRDLKGQSATPISIRPKALLLCSWGL